MYEDKLETADDPAKEFGSVEVWNGETVYVLRNAQGHFVTWRKQRAAEQNPTANKAVADGGHDFTAHDYGEVEVAQKTRGRKAEFENAVVNRWSDHGQDRLYFNNVAAKKVDLWIDLTSGDIKTTGQAAPQIRSYDVTIDGELLVVDIDSAGCDYHFKVEVDPEPEIADDGEETENNDHVGDDEIESKLEDLGINI